MIGDGRVPPRRPAVFLHLRPFGLLPSAAPSTFLHLASPPASIAGAGSSQLIHSPCRSTAPSLCCSAGRRALVQHSVAADLLCLLVATVASSAPRSYMRVLAALTPWSASARTGAPSSASALPARRWRLVRVATTGERCLSQRRCGPAYLASAAPSHAGEPYGVRPRLSLPPTRRFFADTYNLLQGLPPI
jgi:hypothetical protein